MSSVSSYLVISNVWNEEGNLDSIFKQLLKQTIKPTHWLMINDGSTDNTLDELEELKLNNSQYIPLTIFSTPKKSRGNLDTLGVAIRTALKSISRRYDFYVKLDIDTVLPANYFEKIFEEFAKDPKLMCASGVIFTKGKKEPNRRKWARGTGLTIRGNFFDYYRSDIPEVTLETWIGTLAEIHGYKTKEFQNIKEVQLKPTTQLTEKGTLRRGRLMYYFGFHPLAVFIRSITEEFVLRKNGKAILHGYLIAKRNKWKIKNNIIRQYWFKNLFFIDLKSLLSKFRFTKL